MTATEPLVCQPMRPLETVERPSFPVPSGACDAHMHVFGPLETYPCVAKPHYTLPDGTLEHYLQLMPILGIERFVIVQPSFYGTDNSCLLDRLKSAGDQARGIVMVEPEIGREELSHFHQIGVRGVRIDLFKRASEPLSAIQRHIEDMAEKIAPLGWHLQFYAPGWLVRDLIGFFSTLTIDYVIDHMGYMLEEDGLTEADFERLLQLIREGSCWIKLSAPYRLAKKKGYAAVAPVAQAIVRTAPDKALWGSDWPHLVELGRDSGELLNLLPIWAPNPEDCQAILVDNPAKLFGFS